MEASEERVYVFPDVLVGREPVAATTLAPPTNRSAEDALTINHPGLTELALRAGDVGGEIGMVRHEEWPAIRRSWERLIAWPVLPRYADGGAAGVFASTAAARAWLFARSVSAMA